MLKKLLGTTKHRPEGETDPLDRAAIARRYLAGRGIEIGALHNPLPVPPGVAVQYVDRFSLADLKRHYPELANGNVVDPDIVDDGETLGKIADASQEFVIANHFLEHCENPLLALRNMIRVLRSGGVLFLAVPDMRHTFDRNRPVTPLEHLIRDYEQGPEWSRQPAYEQWATLVDNLGPADAPRQVAHYMSIGYSIHFHAWTQHEIVEMLNHLRAHISAPWDWELLLKNHDEVICILRRS